MTVVVKVRQGFSLQANHFIQALSQDRYHLSKFEGSYLTKFILSAQTSSFKEGICYQYICIVISVVAVWVFYKIKKSVLFIVVC